MMTPSKPEIAGLSAEVQYEPAIGRFQLDAASISLFLNLHCTPPRAAAAGTPLYGVKMLLQKACDHPSYDC